MSDGRRRRWRSPGLAVSAVLAAVVLALAADGQNAENVCGHPPVPVNAKLVRDGAKATFVCDDGYRLFGPESITCSSNGAWTGDLPFCGTNVAVHKPTNQSTTARGGSPGNANDGDPTTVHDGRRCTETLKEPSPWWSVDLLQPYPVRAVSITTRGCCDFKISESSMSRKTAVRRATTKKRAQRATSNVFAMFGQAQIQEFKEAFNLIDQNRDGFIDKEDLHDMLASLGKDPTDDYLEGMMNDAPGPINFTMFLTLFGERLQGTDPEDVIKNAFGCFDENNEGVINEERLRELLVTMGDRFTDEDVDEMYREAPISKGMFNYIEFTRILKHGAKEKDEV